MTLKRFRTTRSEADISFPSNGLFLQAVILKLVNGTYKQSNSS
jgi:hypothetical protein